MGSARVSIVELLLSRGKDDIDVAGEGGTTPLFAAVDCGHKQIVKLLLTTNKVDVDLKDQVSGNTPLSQAASKGDMEMVELGL